LKKYITHWHFVARILHYFGRLIFFSLETIIREIDNYTCWISGNAICSVSRQPSIRPTREDFCRDEECSSQSITLKDLFKQISTWAMYCVFVSWIREESHIGWILSSELCANTHMVINALQIGLSSKTRIKCIQHISKLQQKFEIIFNWRQDFITNLIKIFVFRHNARFLQNARKSTQFISAELKNESYVSKLYFLYNMMPVLKYFNSVFMSSWLIAHVPCFVHSCSLQNKS
jgi:hypothetical protein